MPQTYTVKEVADILGYSTNSIYTFLKEKRIKGIRLGKGRFRIPQDELDRLLSSSGKKIQPISVVPNQPVSDPISMAPVRGGIETSRAHMPNFFDWYLGSLAILAGSTMILSLPLFHSIDVASYLVFRPLIATMFIVGAIGLLYADIAASRVRWWRGIFTTCMLLASAAIGWLFFLNHDYPWAFVMVSVIVIVAIRHLMHIDGVRAFLWHNASVWILFLISPLVWPMDERIQIIAPHMPLPLVTMVLIGLAATAFGLYVFSGHSRNGTVRTWALVGVGLLYVGIAFWLGMHAYWLRTFVLLTLAFFTLFVPVWQTLNLARRDHQRIVFQIVLSMVALSCTAIAVLKLFQENTLTYARTDLRQKAYISAVTISSTMQKSKNILELFAQNPLVAGAVADKDIGELEALSRSIFESNATIRRIVTTDQAGSVLSYYPLTGPSPATQNLSHRDYFIQAATSKKTVVSDVLNSSTNPPRPSITIAVPMLDTGKDITGVIVGVLDIEAINLDIQKFVLADRDEYIVVVDKTKKRIMHPDAEKIGIELPVTDSVLRALQGETGVVEDYDRKNLLSLSSFTRVPDVGWAIAVKVPLQNVLDNTTASLIAIVALTCVWIAMLLSILFRFRRREELDVGS